MTVNHTTTSSTHTHVHRVGTFITAPAKIQHLDQLALRRVISLLPTAFDSACEMLPLFWDAYEEERAAFRQHSLDVFDYHKQLATFMRRDIVQRPSHTGGSLALKFRRPEVMDRSEAHMMEYAVEVGVLAPKVRGFYDIVTFHPSKPLACVIIMDSVPGKPLSEAWQYLNARQREDVKQQLHEQVALMRKCTLPYIGRPQDQPPPNVYGQIGGRRPSGPFDSQAAFDEWCLDHVRCHSTTRWMWRWALQRTNRHAPSADRFVLSHCSLSPRNIMVDTDGRLTALVNWERSGFFPQYAEYAFAMKLCRYSEEWWKPILSELLTPCSKTRLKFTYLADDKFQGC